MRMRSLGLGRLARCVAWLIFNLRCASGGSCGGQGADLLKKRGWDDRPDGVSFAWYPASSSLRSVAI